MTQKNTETQETRKIWRRSEKECQKSDLQGVIGTISFTIIGIQKLSSKIPISESFITCICTASPRFSMKTSDNTLKAINPTWTETVDIPLISDKGTILLNIYITTGHGAICVGKADVNLNEVFSCAPNTLVIRPLSLSSELEGPANIMLKWDYQPAKETNPKIMGSLVRNCC
eukprot:TRINITY_DN5972_c0_g1_i1.p1 TRINITY_DN5972_c0_g1~~TRINITY_DN5972_c0_g1_i1.p1  ORF type:complete len:172 (+),score=38.34 TRINITY_DN5972_c0_g1_i1:388-903(+)